MGERPADICAGRIASAHGLDGSFKVVDPVPRLLDVGATVAIRGQLLEVERRAGTDARPIVRVSGIADRAAAEGLRGERLMVRRSAVPELGEDEWWTADLLGCDVSDGDERVGVVTDVRGLPSCEVLVVERAGRGELLVPLVSDAVRSVDVAGRRIDVDLVFLGEAGT